MENHPKIIVIGHSTGSATLAAELAATLKVSADLVTASLPKESILDPTEIKPLVDIRVPMVNVFDANPRSKKRRSGRIDQRFRKH